MDGDNGHNTEQAVKENLIPGTKVNIKDLMRQDGLIAEALDKQNKHSQGVIQSTLISYSDADYRQILRMARWRSHEECDKAVKAIQACRATGAVKALKTILDLITGHTAGVEWQSVHDGYDALTHTTYTWQNKYLNKGKNDRDNSRSPIS